MGFEMEFVIACLVTLFLIFGICALINPPVWVSQEDLFASALSLFLGSDEEYTARQRGAWKDIPDNTDYRTWARNYTSENEKCSSSTETEEWYG